MKMTRRQFALSVAAASTLRSSLFASPLSPIGVPRGVVPGRVRTMNIARRYRQATSSDG